MVVSTRNRHGKHRSKVVIVDDSLSMRRWLNSVIARDPRLEVVGMAATAEEARMTINETAPDVMTLDLEMPGLDGFTFLDQVMRVRPFPVVVLSGRIAPDGSTARRAQALGAAACIPKPALPTPVALLGLCDRIVSAAQGTALFDRPHDTGRDDQLMLVGASTGGVAAIERLIATLPDDGPGVVIAQHMPHGFLAGFVERLNNRFPQAIGLARDGQRIRSGEVLVAPALGTQTTVRRRPDGAWCIDLVARSADGPFCPSVDILFRSATPWADAIGAALLTGLGKDGAQGIAELRRSGARTIGQSRDSCVVYGMPAAARALNGTETEASIDRIGPTLLRMMRNRNARRRVQ